MSYEPGVRYISRKPGEHGAVLTLQCLSFIHGSSDGKPYCLCSSMHTANAKSCEGSMLNLAVLCMHILHQPGTATQGKA